MHINLHLPLKDESALYTQLLKIEAMLATVLENQIQIMAHQQGKTADEIVGGMNARLEVNAKEIVAAFEERWPVSSTEATIGGKMMDL